MADRVVVTGARGAVSGNGNRITFLCGAERQGRWWVGPADLGGAARPGEGQAGHMTTNKASSGLLTGSAGIRIATAEKTAAAQGDKPAKAVRRLLPKPLRPKVMGNPESTAILPPVILWDDPVDPATGAKPKR